MIAFRDFTEKEPQNPNIRYEVVEYGERVIIYFQNAPDAFFETLNTHRGIIATILEKHNVDPSGKEIIIQNVIPI